MLVFIISAAVMAVTSDWCWRHRIEIRYKLDHLRGRPAVQPKTAVGLVDAVLWPETFLREQEERTP